MKLNGWFFKTLMVTLLVCFAAPASLVWGESPASVEKMAYPLPDKPSFAILPFENTGGEDDPKYLRPGFTNSLFAALSDTPGVFVIHPMSTSKYGGKPFTVKQVAEELGVQYVVTGSFQKSGDQLAISAQMIDALKGALVWKQTYNRKMADILKIQDDIALNMVKSAGANYANMNVAGSSVEGTNKVEAYLKSINADNLTLKRSPEKHREAKDLYQKAIALDTNYLNPYIGLVHTLSDEARWGFTDSPQVAMESARKTAQAAIDLNPSSSPAHTAMGRALYNLKEHDKAIAALNKAAALDSDNTFANMFLGWTLCYAGRPHEAISAFQKMQRSNPLNPQWALLGLGAANLFAGNYEEAIPYYQKMIDGGSKFYRAYLDIAACQVALGRMEEAKANCDKVLKLNPKFTLTKHITRLPAKDQASISLYTQALRKLSLPE